MSVFEPIFQILNTAGVRYVVVGGLATVLHGYARLTADVDLAVDLAPEEATKMIRTLVTNGFRPQVPVRPEAFADPDVREVWLRDKHMLAFSLVDQANPMRVVDLLLKPDVPFEDLWARSEEVALNTTRVRIASVHDLIALNGMPAGHRIWPTLNSWKRFDDERETANMADKSSGSSNVTQLVDWNAAEQNLLAATLSATPAQRLAWLEEALQLAYASGALKLRTPIGKGEREAASSRAR